MIFQPKTPGGNVLAAVAISFAAIFAWSAYRSYGLFTWMLEVFPAVIGIGILAATWRRFQFTTFIYGLIWAHAVVLCIGGHYTYARVPAFHWLRDTFHLSRNYYDRVGHFFQGLVPTMIARELMMRLQVFRRRSWMPFVLLSIALAISAAYELLEWQVAAWSGARAEDFLGTQGDVWDTQEDMATCLVGAVCGLVMLSRHHDRQMGVADSGSVQ
jgi:putative membrane protein